MQKLSGWSSLLNHKQLNILTFNSNDLLSNLNHPKKNNENLKKKNYCSNFLQQTDAHSSKPERHALWLLWEEGEFKFSIGFNSRGKVPLLKSAS